MKIDILPSSYRSEIRNIKFRNICHVFHNVEMDCPLDMIARNKYHTENTNTPSTSLEAYRDRMSRNK